MTQFLNGGGKLIITGMNALYLIEGSPFVRSTLNLDVASLVGGETFSGASGTAFAGESYTFNSPTSYAPYHVMVAPATSAAVSQGSYPGVPPKWESWSGTSMATPHATGAAALVASVEPALLENPVGLKKHIMNGTPLFAAAGKTVSGDMVDALKALNPPADSTAPTVSSVTPPEGAKDVATTTNVVASFSEAMEAVSVTDPASFTLRKKLLNEGCTTAVPATLSYDSANKKATLVPSAPLDASSTYTVTVSGAWDLAGNQLDQDPNTSGDQPKSWSFTTAAPPPGTSLPKPNVWAWGYNENGQLGDCTTTDRTTPVQVSDLSGVKDVAGGFNHSLALKDDGTVWAWGANFDGQVGTTTNRSTPVQVDGLSGITHVVGGMYHSFAVSTDIPPGDSQAPSPPSITSPQNNSYDTEGSFSVSGSAEAASTVELFEGTASKGTTKADSSSGAWSIDLSGVSDGAHTYSAKATDAAGNTSSASNSVTVRVDRTAPTLGTVSPTNAATGVPLTATVEATFLEDMNPGSITDQTFTLTKEGSSGPVAVSSVGYNSQNRKASLDPASDLEANATYTATIKGGSTGVKDLAGNALAQDHIWTFTTATPQSPSCTITGTANAETISGTSADDVICAGGGNDTVKGLEGNDTLKGEAGNDQLLGGVGNDTLDGEIGTDTASYSPSLTAVTASLATNSATGEGSDTFLGVENLLGSSKADSLTGSETNNKLTGGGGPDTEQGGLGNDQVIGSGGADTLKGEDGDDTVNSKDGVNGNDSLDGGAGTDTKVTDATEKSIVNFP